MKEPENPFNELVKSVMDEVDEKRRQKRRRNNYRLLELKMSKIKEARVKRKQERLNKRKK